MIRFLLIVLVQFSLIGLIAQADPLQIVDSDTSDPRDYVKSTQQLLLETSSVPVSKAMERISSRVSKLFEECKPPAIEHVPRLTAACKMVEEIHRISPKVALPLAKRHTGDCLAAAKLSGTAGDRFLATAAVFCQWRYKAGDEAAVKEYASLLASADPDSFTQLPKLLKFLLTYPEEPVLAEVAEGLFSESDGEWNPIVGFKDRYYAGYSARDAYTEPLLWRHPAFKRQLIRLLDDLS